jgi:hypothetical protein
MKILENKQLLMDCPVCDKKHYVHIIKREAKTVIEGKEVIYPETVYICKMENSKEDEFIPAKVMDENLATAKKEYEKRYVKKKEEPEKEEEVEQHGESESPE